ncbi:hypothetical protein FHR96_000561 [Halomonas organivorans]|uniref:Uncharacterized protein n=1 Tax=Halomonas organivorans TaxID=257772 RepID=A0A7W5G431_9GAMM|nr:hypothetical protein [Halomonas organivorans]
MAISRISSLSKGVVNTWGTDIVAMSVPYGDGQA